MSTIRYVKTAFLMGGLLPFAGVLAVAQTPVVTSIAGGVDGFSGDGGPASQAVFNTIQGLALDSSGNIFVADAGNFRVRLINAANQTISTVAGNGTILDSNAPTQAAGPALMYALYSPSSPAIRTDGTLFFLDFQPDAVSPAGNLTPDTVITGQVQQVVDKSGSALNIISVTADNKGNVYVLTTETVFLYTPGVAPQNIAGNINSVDSGNTTSGDGGPATNATFTAPTSIAVDTQGNIYVGDPESNGSGVIRRFKAGGTITTIAGIPNFDPTTGVIPVGYGNGGPATQAVLTLSPSILANDQVAVDGLGNVYVIDQATNQVRRIDSSGTINAYAGNGTAGKYLGDGGPALSAVISANYLAADSAGDLFIAQSAQYPSGAATGFGKVTEDRILEVSVPKTTATPPVITGVASAAGDLIAVTPGGFAAIYGTNLAPGTLGWGNSIVGDALPTSLSGVSVTVDGKLAAVNFVSPGQINILVPDDTTNGPVNVVVTNASGASAPFSVSMASYSPGFFTLDGTHVIALHLDNSLVAATGFNSTSHPAAAGETIVLYGTGFGPTSPATPSNILVAAAAPLVSADVVSVSVGGVPATVLFAGIVEAGLYQLNVTLPATLSAGDQLIVAAVNTTASQSGTVLPIQ